MWPSCTIKNLPTLDKQTKVNLRANIARLKYSKRRNDRSTTLIRRATMQKVWNIEVRLCIKVKGRTYKSFWGWRGGELSPFLSPDSEPGSKLEVAWATMAWKVQVWIKKISAGENISTKIIKLTAWPGAPVQHPRKSMISFTVNAKAMKGDVQPVLVGLGAAMVWATKKRKTLVISLNCILNWQSHPSLRNISSIYTKARGPLMVAKYGIRWSRYPTGTHWQWLKVADTTTNTLM